MNFVSPRKLDRIHSFDVVFNDALAGIINVWWFVDYFGLDENAVSFSFFCYEQMDSLKKLPFTSDIPDTGQCPMWMTESKETVGEVSFYYMLCLQFAEYVLKTVRNDAEQVLLVHQQDLVLLIGFYYYQNNFYASKKKISSASKSDAPKRKIRPSSLFD